MEDRDAVLVRAQTIIRELRGRLAAAEQQRPEPVAIVGMACRFPNGLADRSEREKSENQEANEDLPAFWRMTLAGRSAEQAAPEGRWAAAEERRPFLASFLEDVALFDAGFFDIPASEAMEMDPAQRLFLEVAWHALQDAGETKMRLDGSDTGVFVGHTGFHEYLCEHMAAGAEIGVYTGTGNGEDVIAGRLAYSLNLHGPAMTVNTACSSSLVAIHLARRSLLAGECGMAVAGGVNILGPVSTALAMQMGFMAPDGRCKVFDERADGFGRGEGCGVVVLKRLSDAERDGDLVHAVIHGSAVNQDGRTNGLSAPNGRSQAALLRRALSDAGIAASQVGYVEAHGTGTPLGDLIEFGALAEVYGLPEGSLPCALGSAKANFGHQEGAAGVAGLLRAVLAVEHGLVPPMAGFRRLNPEISLEGTRFAIPVVSGAWSGEYAARLAGVSSFGWSGTNAHIVLGEAPAALDRHAESNKGRTRLAPYVFQRRRYWIPPRESGATDTLAPDDWFYETVWTEMPLQAQVSATGPSVMAGGSIDQAGPAAKTWLIFADETGVAQQLAGAIAERGGRSVLIWPGAALIQRGTNEFEANATNREQMELVFGLQPIVDAGRLSVVFLQALDIETHRNQSVGALDVAAVEKCLEAVIRLCQVVAEEGIGRTIRVWAVTRGAHVVQDGDGCRGSSQAPMHGFASAAALEHPEFWAGTIDLAAFDTTGGDAGKPLLLECEIATRENRVAYRDGRRFVARLRRTQAPPPTELKLQTDATYVVTGAFGGIGPDLAAWLAENGAKHLLLLGRSGHDDSDALRGLRDAGVDVKVERCDVADLGAMSELFARMQTGGHPVRGILHAAAEVVWKPILKLDSGDLKASLRAKVRGSLVLHELTKRMGLDFLVFFSSAAASIGARNAAAYAAGNAFMDALAMQRRSAGLAGLSVQWGHWNRRDVHRGVDEQQFTASGLAAMPGRRALNALGRLLKSGAAICGSRQDLIAEIDVDRLRAGVGARSDSLFLSDLDGASQRVDEPARPAAIAALEGRPEANRLEGLTMLVTEQLRRALDWDAARPVDSTRGFFDMGIDSLKSIQFKNYIESATGTVQSSTLIFLYPNVDAVAKFLNKSLFGKDAQQEVAEANRDVPSAEQELTESETRAALLAELELFKGGGRG